MKEYGFDIKLIRIDDIELVEDNENMMMHVYPVELDINGLHSTWYIEKISYRRDFSDTNRPALLLLTCKIGNFYLQL